MTQILVPLFTDQLLKKEKCQTRFCTVFMESPTSIIFQIVMKLLKKKTCCAQQML